MIQSRAASRRLALIVVTAVFWMFCLEPGVYSQGRARSGVGTIPAGTTIEIRTVEKIDTNDADDVFLAVVDKDVRGANGSLVIPRGSDAELVVRQISNNELALDLNSVTVNGQTYGVANEESSVTAEKREGVGANSRTGKYVGGGALLGAIIGGIAGGGKGAAIGAGAGAAAGAGTQALTRGGKIDVPVESLITFRLTEPLQAGYGGYSRRSTDAVGTASYEQGYRDGRADAQRNRGRNPQMSRWTNSRDRRDYQAGYNEGYDSRISSNGRRSGSDTGEYFVSSGPNRTINWRAPANSTIYVQVDNEAPKLFASGDSGSQSASWMRSGHLYTFTVRDAGGREVTRTRVDLR